MIPATFTTKRLAATRLSPGDLELLYAMHRDPAVMAMLGGIRSPARTRAFLGANLRHWQQRGYGLWIFRDRTGGQFVGRGGIRDVMLQGRPETEINYALMPSYWGRGLATEIATVCVELATRVGRPELVAFALPSNRGSRHVMEKVGFRYEHDIVYAGQPHVLYRYDWTLAGGRTSRPPEGGGGLGGPEPPNFK